jgi:hypothetical protein
MKMEKQKLTQNLEYKGKYQIKNERLMMQYESDQYTQYQNYLYKRALYGLDSLNAQELEQMCSKKKQRIINVYKKAQAVINSYKQELTIKYTNILFETFFPKSPMTAFFLENTETDEKFKNTLTFKDLNISKEDVISIFIQEGVLPKNFLSLTTDPNQLPRLRTK